MALKKMVRPLLLKPMLPLLCKCTVHIDLKSPAPEYWRANYICAELDFPGVEVTGLSVETAGRPVNRLFTYLESNSLQLPFGLDFDMLG